MNNMDMKKLLTICLMGILTLSASDAQELDKIVYMDLAHGQRMWNDHKHPVPAINKMGENYMGKHFKKVKDHFDFNSDHTLYGFKHTAVVNWYEKEKNIQKMCQHSSMLMTERYLKSLGLLDDKDAVSELPEI